MRAGNRRYNHHRAVLDPVKSVSFVIINNDSAEYLAGLFDSINKQEGIETAEVIFIDNASIDGSVAAAEKSGIIKIYSFEKKVPVPRLYNKGLELADSPAVIFAHSDIVLCDGFFRTLNDVIRDNDRAPSFINFTQYYVDHNRFGCNFIGFTINNGVFYYRKYFDWNYNNTVGLVHCSEGCFMIDLKSVKEKPYFDERYQNSLFEYDFIVSNHLPAKCADGGYYHYFIEAHEKLPNFDDDLKLFMDRCWPLLDTLMRKKMSRAKIKIVIHTLVDIVFPQGSIHRRVLSRAVSIFKYYIE
jgi:glycosyltransferase involved in cell wall biosynthesis